MLLTQLMIKHDENKYNEYLTRVEKVKFEMAEQYRLHPSNYITKKDDVVGNYHLHLHHSGNTPSLVNIDDIGW